MRQREEGGYVLVTVAIAMVALLGFVALAVDVGFLYSKRTNYQRAADAAALAGAFTYVVEPASAQPDTAQAHAAAVAAQNTAMGTAIDPSQVTVTFPPPPIPNDRLVKVDITAPSETFFARIFGVSSATIAVTAVAEVGPAPTGGGCAKPWFIPNTILSSLINPPVAPCTACANQNPGTSQLLIAGTSVTQYAHSQLGTRMYLTPQVPQNALAPSQFYAFDFPGSTGANDYRNNIATCVAAAAVCRNLYGVRTGAVIGPTKQGVDALVGNAPDTYVSVGQYQLFNGNVSDTSHQLVIAPIWDTCGTQAATTGETAYCPSGSFPSGTNPKVGVLGFALLFIEGMQGNQVVSRLISVENCAGATISEEAAAPFAMPVRLVKLP